MERKILDTEQLAEAAADLDGWAIDGKVLTKNLKFPNFADALAFVNSAGALAEAADHHPDITFGWGYVQISLTTHDRGGVTDVDVSLAREIDRIEP